MGPDEECLELARYIRSEHPRYVAVDEYALAYTIQAWLEKKEAEDASQ